MAYREVDMWEILEILRRVGRGENTTAIRKATRRSRKTIRRYVALAAELGWRPGEREPDERLAAAVLRHFKPGRKDNSPGEVERRLLPYQGRLKEWLEEKDGKRGLRLTKVHQLLAREGIDVPYSSLHRFAVKYCGFSDRRRLTVRVAPCEPGELAEVDFGRLGLVPYPETDSRRVLHALIVTLIYSRHQYVHVTHSQKLQDLIDGLEDAWQFFGGVSARAIIDNLKAAVTKPDRYDPVFQRTFDEYAYYRGFIIDATVVRHARGKPHVERNVQYVRENFFRGEAWHDRDHVQREALRWCRQVAGTRIHGTTRKRPLAVFENIERARLQPLVKERFDTPVWKECKVHGDHHISFEKALYSVPTRYVGKQVWVKGDSRLVRVYVGGEVVKVHPRKSPGGRSTDYDDYPKERASYAMRDPDRLLKEARRRGSHIGHFMSDLLAGQFPWAKLRQAQKLMRLGEKYGWHRVNQACRRALAFDLVNVRRVETIIKNNLDSHETTGKEDAPAQVVQFPLRFQREAESFTHHSEKGDDESD